MKMTGLGPKKVESLDDNVYELSEESHEIREDKTPLDSPEKSWAESPTK
jgi:hypothetical protein